MAKKNTRRLRTRIEQNAFIKGLITEASPLTFPANASLAEENFILDRDGSRFRRLGMTMEVGGLPLVAPNVYPERDNIETFVWRDAGNNRNLNISVVKVDNLFYFFDADAEAVSASPIGIGKKDDINFPIRNIPIPKEPNVFSTFNQYDFAFVHGRMIVTVGTEDVYIVQYDLVTNTFDVIPQRLKVRDLFGIKERFLSVDERPAVGELSITHEYNLRNQGWLLELKSSNENALADPEEMVDTVAYTGKAYSGKYPSDADMVWANKAGEGTTAPEVIGTYSVSTLRGATYGKQQAPRGRYVIDLFDRGQYRFAPIGGAPGNDEDPVPITAPVPGDIEFDNLRSEGTIGGVTSCVAYMGRTVYAVTEFPASDSTISTDIPYNDANTPAIGSMILFSMASEKMEDMTKCHTSLDPTGGEDFTNLATDGGFVVVTGLGQVNSLEVNGNSLYVFTDTGVWQINGGDRVFTPTNVNMLKISNVGSIGKHSVVIAEDKIFYLSDAGMYVISNGGDPAQAPTVENFSQSTIQTLLDLIPESRRKVSVNTYDKFARQIRWLFGSEDVQSPYLYNIELVFDLNLNAFSLFTIKNDGNGINSPYVVGYIDKPSVLLSTRVFDVVVNQTPVIVTNTLGTTFDIGVSQRRPAENQLTSTKYWALRYTGNPESILTVNEYRQLQFLDWGVTDAEAFLLTGYVTGGDSASFKRVNYITTHMRRTEQSLILQDDGSFDADNPSSCSMQVQWEWTNRPDSGRWSNPQEIYRLPRTFVPDENGDFVYGHTVVTTKNKLRGKGRAFSLLFRSNPLQDCHLYGWSLEVNAETEV